jgi:hypothetical protein
MRQTRDWRRGVERVEMAMAAVPSESEGWCSVIEGDPTARVQAIRDRLAKATEGPWWVHRRTVTTAILNHRDHYVLEQLGGRRKGCDVRSIDDAGFIANAREDVPWLLEQLDASQARAAALAQELREMKAKGSLGTTASEDAGQSAPRRED